MNQAHPSRATLEAHQDFQKRTPVVPPAPPPDDDEPAAFARLAARLAGPDGPAFAGIVVENMVSEGNPDDVIRDAFAMLSEIVAHVHDDAERAELLSGDPLTRRIAEARAANAPPAPLDDDETPQNILGQNKPAKPAKPALCVTRITSRNPAILTKSFTLAPDGTLEKHSVAHLTDGHAEQVSLRDLSDFSALLDSLTPAQAITYGVATDYPGARLVSEKRRAAHPGSISRTRKFFGFRRAPGIWMLDHDPQPGALLTPAVLLDIVRQAAPCLAEVAILWRPSASSHLCGPDGSVLKGAGGQRLYIPVADAALIPEAGKALVDLLWSQGYGRIDIGQAGQALERTPIDAAVWQPERLDFAGPPHLGPGITRNPPAARIDGDPAQVLDLRNVISAADGTVKTSAANARKAARASAAPDLATAKAAWIDELAPRLAEQHHQEEDQVRIALKRACEHRELTGDFILRCSDGTTPLVGDLLDNVAKWHNQRFADPLEPDYGQDHRIAWANLRSGGRPYVHSHAHGGRRFYLVRPSARILLKRGERARVVDQTLDLLRARGDVFDLGTGATLARVTDNATAVPVSRDWLTDYLDRAAEFYTRRASKDEDGNETFKDIPEDAPVWAAMRLVAKDGDRGLPKLDAVVSAPTLRLDGSVLSEPGYDPASRLLLLIDSQETPHVSAQPTLDQARSALATLWTPFRLFPLVDSVDHAVTLAAILTACIRASLPTAPGTGFDAPAAGTGKTLLATAIGALSLGYAPAAMPPAGNQDDETRKRLFAALRDGHRVILWDNVRDGLGNAAMDAFLTASHYGDRILGVSQTAILPNRALFLATGNNLKMLGDTCRRILPARLDARIERPYGREFDFCPLEMVLARRHEMVAAALTLIRAWFTAGRPRHGRGRSASFEQWDDLVRQPVCWLATWDNRFDDPLKATDRAFALDPETAKLASLLAAWKAVIGFRAVTTAKLVEAAHVDDYAPPDDATPALRDAIDEIADERGKLNRRILGRWIERHAERRHDRLRLVRGEPLRGSPTWFLREDAA